MLLEFLGTKVVKSKYLRKLAGKSVWLRGDRCLRLFRKLNYNFFSIKRVKVGDY